MEKALVATAGLSKHYGRLAALESCTLEVFPGEVFGLLGPNGAGKTTLLRLLLGYLHPSAGWARIDGLDCHRQSLAVRQRVAYLPGEARLFRQMRGRDVLRFFASMRGGETWNRAQQLAARLELDVSRRVSFMSTGMRQKLALAATLAANTRLVILDEPTSNLDPTVRGTVLQLVHEARQRGQTIMFSSHVLSEVEQACDRVVILRAGELVHTQVMTELRRQHRIHARVRGTLPPPPAALADQLTIRSESAERVTIETPGDLSTMFGWLSELPLEEVRIEPVGLRSVYDQFHTD
jgi:ABC-2 type transport system ATP-binding protein